VQDAPELGYMGFDHGNQHYLVAAKFGIRRFGHAVIMVFATAHEQRISGLADPAYRHGVLVPRSNCDLPVVTAITEVFTSSSNPRSTS
jgi:hypothetical protein